MKKDFLVKITVFPLVFAVLVATVCTTYFCLNVEIFSPVYEGTVLSAFENTANTEKVVNKDFDEVVSGDCIGKVSAGEELAIVADAPYHQLDSVLSYEIGSGEFGKSGYVYLLTDSKNLAKLKNAITFTADGCFEKHDYVLTGEKHFKSADALKLYTPDINKCVVVYAQDSAGVGIKSTYTALIFEEVQL